MVRMDMELFERLREHAERCRTDRSDLVRIWVSEGLGRGAVSQGKLRLCDGCLLVMRRVVENLGTRGEAITKGGVAGEVLVSPVLAGPEKNSGAVRGSGEGSRAGSVAAPVGRPLFPCTQGNHEACPRERDGKRCGCKVAKCACATGGI